MSPVITSRAPLTGQYFQHTSASGWLEHLWGLPPRYIRHAQPSKQGNSNPQHASAECSAHHKYWRLCSRQVWLFKCRPDRPGDATPLCYHPNPLMYLVSLRHLYHFLMWRGRLAVPRRATAVHALALVSSCPSSRNYYTGLTMQD